MADLTPQGHALGLVLVPPSAENWPYMFSLPSPPPDINWRSRMRPVGSQGGKGSCTGWGGTAAVEAARQDGIQRSPLYVYYYDRAEDGVLPSQDSGATMLALCKALRDYGAPPDDVWPYVEARFSQKPPAEADAAAALCRVESFYQVQGTGQALLQGMWAAVQEGPFPIALKVFESFEHPDSMGRVPMPGSRETVLGGHCICVTGWINDVSAPGGYGWFDCQNSWTDQLGDGGYWRLPAGYILQNIVVEAHVLKVAAGPPPEPEPTNVDKDAIKQRLDDIRASVEYVQGLRPTAAQTKSQILAVVEQVWTHEIGPFDDLAREAEELLLKADPGPGPEPPPTAQFVAPIPNGARYGTDKWMLDAPGGHSYGCDMFCVRGTPVVAPADALVEEVIGGTGLNGGAEVILAMADKSWAWRFRHVAATVRVGQTVKQGQTVGTVNDTSLDMLCAPPVVGFPDRWQHADVSVAKGTDQFPPLGGGGGNYRASQWLAEIGYSGTLMARTPGPPSCGMGQAEAVAFMTPPGRR